MADPSTAPSPAMTPERVRDALVKAENSDPDAIRPILARAVVWHTPGNNLLGGDHMGQEQVVTLMREYQRLANGTFHVEPRSFDAKAGRLTLHATADRGGAKLDTEADVTFKLEDGRVSELWTRPRDAAAWDRFWMS